jgi:hypothetical protein
VSNVGKRKKEKYISSETWDVQFIGKNAGIGK